jgi:hypothetical protein
MFLAPDDSHHLNILPHYISRDDRRIAPLISTGRNGLSGNSYNKYRASARIADILIRLFVNTQTASDSVGKSWTEGVRKYGAEENV